MDYSSYAKHAAASEVLKDDDTNKNNATNNDDNNNVISMVINNENSNNDNNNDNNVISIDDNNKSDNVDEMDEDDVDIDLSKVEYIPSLTAYETICKPRQILQENSLNSDTQEPVENTIKVNYNKDLFTDLILCPICRETFKKTTTVMPCLHRFCNECINRCLREFKTEGHECPLCRKKLASRRNCKLDPNYDKLVAILSKTYDDEASDMSIRDYKKLHEARSLQLRQQSKEKKFQQAVQLTQLRANSNDSLLGKRSISGEPLVHVNFILKPFTFVDPNNPLSSSSSSSSSDAINNHPNEYINDSLKKPYLRAPSGVTIVDLVKFLKTKSQFQRLDFDILIKFQEQVILLSDDVTLKDICVKYYNDADSELALYYRRKTLI